MYTLYVVYQRLEYLLFLYGGAGHTYSLIKMVLNLIILCHFIAVSYFVLGLLEINYGETQSWITIINLQ